MSSGESSGGPGLVDLDPAVTAVVRGAVTLAGLRDFFDDSFGKLAVAAGAQDLDLLSPAFCRYRGTPGDTLDLEVGFVTDRPVRPAGDVVAGSLPGGRAGRLTHRGGFDGLGSSWQLLDSWLRERGLTPGPQRWEFYVTKPSPETDPAELLTELYWPAGDSAW